MNTHILIDYWQIIAAFLCGFLLAGVLVWIVVWWRRGAAARSGKRGEKAVAKELARLRRKDFVVLNDLLLPTVNDRTSQIDHVVVSTRGVFVIETKNHAGRISGAEQAQYWQQHLSSQSRGFYNPILQNRSHLRAIRRHLPKLDSELFSTMVVFTEAWRLDIKADDIVVERSLLPDKHIKRTLIPEERVSKRWWQPWRRQVVLDEHKMVTLIDGMIDEIRRRPRVIDRDSVRLLAEKLIAVNITDSSVRKQHTEYAKRTSSDVSADIRKGRCPRCGGELIVKKTEKGEFVGCSNYPKCRFTCTIDRLHSK
ncbi:MAG: NERD domain-containing protein [Muribaculaceae bacterium]|nr:NERD domain-containing protein [Muribaculaceae bacterium]